MWFPLSHTREVLWGWEPVASPGNDTSTASLGLNCGLNIDLWHETPFHLVVVQKSTEEKADLAIQIIMSSYSGILGK